MFQQLIVVAGLFFQPLALGALYLAFFLLPQLPVWLPLLFLWLPLVPFQLLLGQLFFFILLLSAAILQLPILASGPLPVSSWHLLQLWPAQLWLAQPLFHPWWGS